MEVKRTSKLKQGWAVRAGTRLQFAVVRAVPTPSFTLRYSVCGIDLCADVSVGLRPPPLSPKRQGPYHSSATAPASKLRLVKYYGIPLIEIAVDAR